MKKAIVTGAGGFIGSSLVKKLLSGGVETVALDIAFPDSFPEGPGLTKIKADLNTIADMQPIECDAFYHLAWGGVNGPDKGNPYVQLTNVSLALKCIDYAQKCGCKSFLCAGTIAERACESLPRLDRAGRGMLYGAAKNAARVMGETYAKNIGLGFVWMQFSNIYGPGNATGNLISYTLGQLAQNAEATFGPALQPYDFIYVDDLIEAVYRLGAREAAPGFYYLGSGKPRILKDYLTAAGRLAGKEDLIRTGVRPDDGIKYTYDMFDVSATVGAIGEYAVTDFETGIRRCLEAQKQ